MSRSHLLYIFLMIISFSWETQAHEIRFEHFDYLKGPIHNGITSITQDSYDQIWTGSRNGLCKYNGYDLTSYISSSSPNSIPNNFIKTLAQDSNGYMWIGTDNGICRYIYELDSFERYDIPNATIGKIVIDRQGRVFCSSHILYRFHQETQTFIPVQSGTGKEVSCDLFDFDAQDNLWVTVGSNLICYDKDFNEQFKLDISQEKDTPKNRDAIISLYIDEQGNKWIGKNGNGIIKIDSKTHEIKSIYTPESREEGIIRSIAQDRHGDMWFGTEKGILLYNGSGEKQHIRKNTYNSSGLNDNAIYCIKKDNQGNMWVGTYFGGINTFYDISSQFNYYTINYNSKGLKASAIRQIIEDEEHQIWIASEDGGLYRYNPKEDLFTKFKHPSINTENIHSIQIDPEKNLWIGTFMHGLVKYNLRTGQSSLFNRKNSSIPENSIFSLYIDPAKTLWIGTSSGLAFYDSKQNRITPIKNKILNNNFVYYLTGDYQGNIWIGLRVGGLVKYSPKKNTIKQWNIKSTHNRLTDNYVTTIIADKKSNIWFGTNNGGLYHLNTSNDSLSSFLNEGKINANCIYSITEDSQANIWVTTNNGLYKIQPDLSEAVHFTSNDGLPTENFNYTSSFFSSQGLIFAGTNKGLITFNPQSLKKDTHIPHIIFTNLSIGGKNILPQNGGILDKNINYTDELKISYTQAKFLGIEFAGVQTGANKAQNYQVFIDGLSTDWQNIGSQRKFIFPVLDPGKYVFKVRTHPDNIRTLKITVTPPFYETIWAYLTYMIIGLLALYYLYKRQEKRLYEKQLIRINIIEKEKLLEMNELRRNFFINISHEFKTPLSLIISPAQKLLNAYDMPEKAKVMLHDILNNSKRLFDLIQELVNFNKMEITKPSLSVSTLNPRGIIEQTSNSFKFMAQEKSIDYHITRTNIPEEITIDKSILEKVLTNLLSNAFKFTNKGGRVDLDISTTTSGTQHFLVIKVTDNGIGISKEHLDKIFDSFFQVNSNNKTGWGIGLSYIKNLIEMHKGDITVESTINQGSCFTARINITPESLQEFIVRDTAQVEQDKNNDLKTDPTDPEDTGVFSEKNETVNTQPQYEIMIVEDNSDMLRFLEESFAPEYKVLTATNGKEALSLLESQYPDLIISDLMMPEINGLELCEKVKTNILTSHIPFILLTAKTGEESTIEGYKHGADIYIEKPFNYQILQLQVKNILQTKENDRKYFKKSPTNIKRVAHNPYDEKFLEDIKQLIEKNISNEDFSINDITETIGVSRTVLHVKFKKMLDMTVGDYIKELRIEKAKRMLEQGYTISDTAYATGFSNPNYFSKSFKKETGQSPSEYIKGLISE